MSSFTHLFFDDNDAVGTGRMARFKGVSSRLNTLFGCRKWMDNFRILQKVNNTETKQPHFVLHIRYVEIRHDIHCAWEASVFYFK
jgi:hypothetical protein